MPTIMHDEPAHDGREQAAQATQERCQGHLDRGGEQRHAEDRRQPAGLGGEERRPDIDRREDRCRQVAGADRRQTHGLKRRADGKRREPKAQGTHRRRGGCAGPAKDDHDQHQVDRHQQRVLQAQEDQPRPGRHVVDGVDQVVRPLGHPSSSPYASAVSRSRRDDLAAHPSVDLAHGAAPVMVSAGSGSAVNLSCGEPYALADPADETSRGGRNEVSSSTHGLGAPRLAGTITAAALAATIACAASAWAAEDAGAVGSASATSLLEDLEGTTSRSSTTAFADIVQRLTDVRVSARKCDVFLERFGDIPAVARILDQIRERPGASTFTTPEVTREIQRIVGKPIHLGQSDLELCVQLRDKEVGSGPGGAPPASFAAIVDTLGKCLTALRALGPSSPGDRRTPPAQSGHCATTPSPTNGALAASSRRRVATLAFRCASSRPVSTPTPSRAD